MPLTLPNSRVGPAINEAPINTNFAAIAAKFNAGLTGADFASNANVPGTAIATGSLPANRIVANDITASQIAASTITATQIAANTITGSNVAVNTVLSGNLKVSSFPWTLPTLSGASNFNSGTLGGFATQITNLTTAQILPLALSLENASAPTGASSSLSIAYHLYLNVANSTYYLVAQNVGPNTFTPAGQYTLRLWYVSAS